MTNTYQKIAISGEAGTGKSSLAKLLTKQLGWEYLNLGDLLRQWHKENNVPIEQTSSIPEELDRKIDQDFQNRIKTQNHTIFEARLAGFFAKDSPEVLKILLTTEEHEALKRISGRDKITLEEAKQKTAFRSQELEKKFERLYQITDYLNPKFFDLIIDTTHTPPKKILLQVLSVLNS